MDNPSFITVPIPCGIIDSESLQIKTDSHEESFIAQMVTSLLRQLKQETGASAELSPQPGSNLYKTVIITGKKSQTTRCKSKLLEKCSDWLGCVRIKSNSYFLLDEERKVKAKVKDRLSSIIAETGTDIALSIGASDDSPFISINSEGDLSIEITGTAQNLRSARQECLAFLDEMNGLFVNEIEFPGISRILAISGGRDRMFLSTLCNRLGVNIYFPPILISKSAKKPSMREKILLSGSRTDVDVAKKELLTLLNRKRNEIKMDLRINSEKLEFVQAFFSVDLLKIMEKTSTVFDFSRESSTDEKCDHTLSIIAEHESLVKLAAKKIIDLMMSVSCFKFSLSHSLSNDSIRLRIKKSVEDLKITAAVSSNIVSVVGLNHDILLFVKKMFHKDQLTGASDFLFTVDLSSEYYEFITGKKNGKIHKITRSSGCKLDLKSIFSERISIDISSSSSLEVATNGFHQLLDELPAELEFFVADSHHKRIIGVGGKNIQGVMKEYGVYVKFLNSDEFRAIGGLNEYDENVIARTPAKNASNLRKLHLAVMSMVDSEFHLKDTLCVELDHKYHHMLKKIKHQIEETQDCKIFFPVCGEGLDGVQIHAKKEKKLLVLSQLQAVLPESFVFPLRTETAVKVFECPEFDILVNLFIEKYSLTLSSHVISDVRIDLITSGSYDAMSRYKAMAIEALATFLRTKGLSILSQKERSRVSFHAFGKDEPLSDDSSIDVLFFQSHSDIVPSFKSRLSTQLAGSAPNLRTSASLTHEYANENPLFATPVKWQRSVNQPPIGSAAISKLRSTSASKISRSLENQHVIIVNQDSSIRSAVDQITSYTNGRQSLPLHIRRNTLEGASIPPKISTKPLFSGGEAFNGITSAPLRERLMSPLMPESFTDQTAPETFEDEISVRNTVIQNITALDSRENNRLGALLEKLDLAKYKEVFSANDVDFEMFLTLTEQDLKELGVSLGARRKMKLAISEIKQKTTTRSSSATVTQLLSAPARQAPWSSGRTNDLIPGLAAYPGPGLGAHLNPFGPMSAFADPQPFISPIAQAFNVSRPLSPQPYGQNLSTADNNCN